VADHFYSVLVGDQFNPNTVTVGTSTSSEAIELRVHDGSSITPLQVKNALIAIGAYFDRNAPTLA
jgi:hypothetical protein